MANKIYLNSTFGYREDTLKNWQTANPVLEKGEISFVRDGYDGKFVKIGDGHTAWNSLPFAPLPKGEKGDKGEKGVDGKDGVNGKDGADYVLTEADKEEIAELIEVGGKGLQLIKDITLTEAVTSIDTTFEKPLKEIYMLFTGTLDGITTEISDCLLSAKTDSGLQYFFYKGLLKFKPDTVKQYIAHAKEIVERKWETVYAGNTIDLKSNTLIPQGLDASSANPRISYSGRENVLSRYVDHLLFSVHNGKYSFALGSNLKIYGVEADE